jgi:hypothetical protein
MGDGCYMSNNYEWYEDDDILSDFDFDSDEDTDDGGSAIKKVRRSERAAQRRVRELEQQLQELYEFKRNNDLSSILSEKGVNPKIAAFIPQDLDIDDNSVTSWLGEYGDLFGISVKPSNQRESQNYNLDAYGQIDAVTGSALTPDGVNDAYSMISNAQSADEILNLIYGNDS